MGNVTVTLSSRAAHTKGVMGAEYSGGISGGSGVVQIFWGTSLNPSKIVEPDKGQLKRIGAASQFEKGCANVVGSRPPKSRLRARHALETFTPSSLLLYAFVFGGT